MYLSIIGFSVKAVCAFILNWMAANYFPVDAFSLWAIFFSVSMVLSAGDLGIGQYILTYMTNYSDDQTLAIHHFSTGQTVLVFLCAPVWLVGMVLVYFSGIDIVFGALLCAVVVMRLPLISYASLLQVKNRLHEKRMIDAIPYLISVPSIFLMQSYEFSVYLQLLVVNFLLLGGSLIILYRCKTLGLPNWEILGFEAIKDGLKASFPYLLNNASGIMIYGGFIGIFGFYIDSYQVAVLAIYHTVILSLGYQAFEVIFRNYQLRILEKRIFNNLVLFLFITGSILLVFSANYGQQVFTYFYSTYKFIKIDLVLFLVFSLLEFGYLLLTLRLQMSVNSSSVLHNCSILKLGLFVLVLIYLSFLSIQNIEIIIRCLILFSAANLLSLIYTRKKYYYR